MDCSEYAALRERAAGRCELCGTPEEQAAAGRLIIDHAHDYGDHAVRGMLCSSCNSKMRDADYATPTRRSHNKEIAAYLANSWFMQVVRWSRSVDNMLGLADMDGQSLADAAFKNPSVRRLTHVLNTKPVVESYMKIESGSAVLHIRSTFTTEAGVKVTADLAHRAGKAFVNDYIEVALPGQRPARFTRVPDALGFLREGSPGPSPSRSGHGPAPIATRSTTAT